MPIYTEDFSVQLQLAHQRRSLLSDMVMVNDQRWFRVCPNLIELLYRIVQVVPVSQDTTFCFDHDGAVQKLNKQFRKKNKPTNVLTFEHAVMNEQNSGDIILALQTIQREAKQNKRIFSHHLSHLIIHGLLHLQGYDHIYVDEAKEMEMQEAKLLQKLNIPNPWKINSLRSI